MPLLSHLWLETGSVWQCGREAAWAKTAGGLVGRGHRERGSCTGELRGQSERRSMVQLGSLPLGEAEWPWHISKAFPALWHSLRPWLSNGHHRLPAVSSTALIFKSFVPKGLLICSQNQIRAQRCWPVPWHGGFSWSVHVDHGVKAWKWCLLGCLSQIYN